LIVWVVGLELRVESLVWAGEDLVQVLSVVEEAVGGGGGSRGESRFLAR